VTLPEKPEFAHSPGTEGINDNTVTKKKELLKLLFLESSTLPSKLSRSLSPARTVCRLLILFRFSDFIRLIGSIRTDR